MDTYDAADEVHGAVKDFCENAKDEAHVKRAQLGGDGNMASCTIFFEDGVGMDKIRLFGGHTFSGYLDDASYGPVELEVRTKSGRIKTQQSSHFGSAHEREESSLESIEVDGTKIKFEQTHGTDEGYNEISI